LLPPFGEHAFDIGHEILIIENMLEHQLSVALRLTDDAHPVPKYLPEQGLANRCQVNKIYGTASSFSNIRDELYLLLGSHRAIAHDGNIYVTVTSCRASRDRTKNVGQLNVGIPGESDLNLPDCHTKPAEQ